MRTWLLRLAAAAALIAVEGVSMAAIDIPVHEPSDPVMAPAAQCREMDQWVRRAFAGEPARPSAARAVVDLVRQDHAALELGKSCMQTTIKIGSRTFKRGLGTHAPSEILVRLPPGSVTFAAEVGVDNNFDTQGFRGSVVFVVKAADKELFRSKTLKGGGEPVPCRIAVPAGTTSITLITEATDDGPGFDQADWADARVVTSGGKTVWLDADRRTLPFADLNSPFSFELAGKPSASFIASWERSVSSRKLADRTERTVRWQDPQSGLAVTAVVSVFDKYPAVDWVLYFENRGTSDTPLISNILALDAPMRAGSGKHPARIHQLRGDSCNETSFLPFETPLAGGQKHSIVSSGGRPSQTSAFPFFNFQHADSGFIAAVGWTGQWGAWFDRSLSGPTRVSAGMEQTRLVLRPGEKIRSPRILLLSWTGDRMEAHNRFRRLLMWHYAPKQHKRPLKMPVALQTFDIYNGVEQSKTEAGQLASVSKAKEFGCDTYWFDAGWFPGGFPGGVGNWRCKPDAFPRGLAPIGEACDRLGLQFVLWFEPERVAEGTDIAREHPEFVHGGAKGGLFKLDDPEARKWMTGLLSERISEYGVDVYRNDFNMDPLGHWRAADSPDRQGITEIRYVEGLYRMWDDLLERHPGLWIDNCSSGGRRIDLEMVMRSVPLWRSDTNCWAGTEDWSQSQGAGLGLYVPLHAAATYNTTAYTCRSSATSGLLCEFDHRNTAFPTSEAQAALKEVKANAPYWFGDLYPLTPITSSPDQFFAFQLHRPDAGAGLVTAFRRADCSTVGIIVELKGISPGISYRLDTSGDDRKVSSTIVTGKKLLEEGLAIRIPKRRGSLLVRYSPVSK